VIHECSKCGALLFEDAGKCTFCDATLHAAPAEEEYATVPAHEVEPDWRVEVARRMEIYRARRRRYMPDDSQTPLLFQGESLDDSDETTEPAEPPSRPARKLSPPRAPERVEISILQPELDFSASSDDRAHPQTALVPVASLHERREAGLLDAVFLAISYVGFVGLFHSLGGRLSFTKVDGAVFAATFFLLYTIYFSIFTFFGGATPGMQLRGLYVVRLDGRLAETRQLLWRTFGYLLSGGALMMGFLWALWDDDRFTWHDRMSHTYVTETLPLDLSESIEMAEAQQTFAHK
jgi:uncharacterized RDD family membrane protein YckC/uncharacterized Zn finger protein (UPF0148 family)